MEYDAILMEQLPGGPRMVIFAAPVREIESWSGIPQRRRVDGQVETAGFQREEKPKRVADIAAFMADPENVIQNPLLAAVQVSGSVEVTPDEVGPCTVTIDVPDLDAFDLGILLHRAMSSLEARIPELSSRETDMDRVARLRQSLSLPSADPVEALPEDPYDADSPEMSDLVDPDTDTGPELNIFDDESQVADFYDELRARSLVLSELGEAGSTLSVIGGFSRDFLASLIKPVVLVDGQHRLRGALKAIQDFEESDAGTEELARLVDEGIDPESAVRELSERVGRRLPVSLLLDASPAEHVFQFVVVNQKATQMTNALLGTIVSTSLSRDEMDPIRQRLKNAGIELEGSRAISYMRKAVESPFRDLVSTGVAGDTPNALPWTVLGGLVSIVRDLEGGEPFHPPKVDYASLWCNNGFKHSELVDLQLEPQERLATWSEFDGPWRTMFVKLHTRIRDKFGNVDDPRSRNYWGSTRSNLFNMVSLRILTSDFFAFIYQRSFREWNEVDAALEEWIGDLNSSYFARDWRMDGMKRDVPAIKEAWSATWTEYRLTRDRLPRIERYNPGGRRVSS